MTSGTWPRRGSPPARYGCLSRLKTWRRRWIGSQPRSCHSSPDSVGLVDGAQLVEAVGEGVACQCAEDGCLGIVGEPGEVLSGVVGDQTLPGPLRPGGPQRLVADG